LRLVRERAAEHRLGNAEALEDPGPVVEEALDRPLAVVAVVGVALPKDGPAEAARADDDEVLHRLAPS